MFSKTTTGLESHKNHNVHGHNAPFRQINFFMHVQLPQPPPPPIQTSKISLNQWILL